MFELLRKNPRYLKYWLSTWASEGADWVRNMAMTYVVLEMSKGSATAFSINMFCEFAPIFLFGFLVGALADRWDRKRTILGAVAFRMAMMVFLSAAVMLDSLWMVYVGSFISAFGTLFYRAPSSAFTMQFVPEEDRKAAANLRQLSFSMMILLGSAVGTGLFMVLRGTGALAVSFAQYAVTWLLVQRVRVDRSEIEAGTGKGVADVWTDMREGFRYAWKHPIVRTMLTLSVFFGFGAGLVNVLEIFITTEYLGLPKEVMGALIVVQGIGMLGSTFLVARLKLSMKKLVVYGMVIDGLGLAGMVAYPSVYATGAALLVFSLGQVAVNVGMSTLMQTKVAFEYQGRASMAFQTMFNGFMVLALLSSGWLHEAFTVQPVVAAGGLLIAAGGAVCAIAFAHGSKSQENEASVSL